MDRIQAAKIISEIINSKIKSIIPVVGNGAFYCEENNTKVSLHEYFATRMTGSERNNSRDTLCSMSRILFDYKQRGKIKDFLLDLDKIQSSADFKKSLKIDEDILIFLRRSQPRLIITTSWLPQEHIDRLLNNEQECRYKNIIYKGEKKYDITLDEDNRLVQPTIVHLLGGDAMLFNPPVLTEKDFLKRIHLLHDTSTKPPQLMTYVRNNILLTLGSEMSDWPYRFVLYALTNGAKKEEMTVFTGGTIDNNLEASLMEYLDEIDYYSDNEMGKFLGEVNKLLPEPEDKHKIFLSYTAPENTSDYHQIKELKNKLEQGFDVFLFPDNPERTKAGAPYWHDIETSLEKSDIFMPVISQRLLRVLNKIRQTNTLELKKDTEPGIISEWKIAMKIMENPDRIHPCHCIPYLYECTLEELKSELVEGNAMFHKLFFDGDGTHALTKPVNAIDVNQDIYTKFF